MGQSQQVGKVPVVTQKMLATYGALKAALESKDALRREIMARLASGASVEPGFLTVQVKENDVRQFTEAELVRLLGREQTNKLKQLLHVSRRRQLIVSVGVRQ